jgi:Fe-S-cluster containining protein
MTEREVAFDAKDPFVRPLIEGAARVAKELYEEQGESTGTALAVASELSAFGGEMARTLVEQVEAVRRLPLACSEGCSFCCRGTAVLAQAVEVLAIGAHLRKTRTEEQLVELRTRVDSMLTRVRDQDASQRAEGKEPCPLLDVEKGACTVYEVRPTSCRSYNSCDAERCREAFDAALTNPVLPMNPILFQATHASGFGLMVATELTSREVGPYELVNGLATVLADPEAEAKWLRGEQVFSHTKISDEASLGYRDVVSGLAEDFRGGRLREAQKLVERVDPDERRKQRNKRKALGKKK